VLLLDNSAWSHLNSERLPEKRRKQVMAWIEQQQIATCLPFLLEMGYSARSAEDHRTLMAGMTRLPNVEISVDVEEHALRAQRELAVIGHHRLAPIDVMIAACAHDADMGVLHYDSDYDVLSQRTSLRFESEWLAPPGTL
jgi:predicted nucleic acid-binding protein